MTSYSIKELEQLSGIKAHTLRIWEKRYKVLTPERTATNIRQYGDDDLKRLLNVTTLLNHGWKISKASALSIEELGKEVERLFQKTSKEEHEYSTYINALVLATMEFDEGRFEQIFASALLLLGLKETIIKIIYPFLNKIGLMWSVWKVHPGQEHFASNLVRKKLFSAIDQLPVLHSQKDAFLLFLPAEELHEIGLLFANYLLRSEGFKVHYLGQSVPFESLKNAIEVTNPKHLLTFFVSNQPLEDIQQYLELLSQHFPALSIHVAGRNLAPLSNAFQKNIRFHTSPPDLFDLL